jgi:UPF0042 nucleotide-binding protein
MTVEDERQELLVVTGMSGAGRSTVGNALEDLGWYVVDNLPPQMLTTLVRRPHPLQDDGTLLDGIARERRRMEELREGSDLVIDTSELNIHQLATSISGTFAEEDTPGVQVTVVSFGFKYGLPADADLVADMRFLPNPFWIPELKQLTGLDAEVGQYVLGAEGASEFVKSYAQALTTVLAGYQRENKRHATIAIGCTGGKHRSVAVAEKLASLLRGLPGVAVSVKHRDLGRE